MISLNDISSIISQEMDIMRKEYQQLLFLTLSHANLTPLSTIIHLSEKMRGVYLQDGNKNLNSKNYELPPSNLNPEREKEPTLLSAWKG